VGLLRSDEYISTRNDGSFFFLVCKKINQRKDYEGYDDDFLPSVDGAREIEFVFPNRDEKGGEGEEGEEENGQERKSSFK
jgi:hypothetical protein